MVLVGRWLLLLAGVLAKQHQYCIIGAGPAGLQLGHFLFHAQRDYVIFERAAAAGSFFEQYPRHRRLISLNKRTVREGRTKDFAFRHGWNSLIDLKEESARTTPVTARSKELFPHASVLVDYLRDFALEQKDHIRYSTEVLKVRRTEDGFELKLVIGDAVCRELILATGFHRPRPADAKVDGSHLLLGYEALPASGEAFQGQAVLVLGQGNAALETAQELQHYTSEVHLLSRARTLPEGGHGVRFAYQTHYVGDIRAGRTTILDTYLLKSLDTFDFDALNGQHRLVILPCGGRLCLWSVQADDCLDRNCSKQHALGGQNLSYKLPVGTAAKDSDLHRRMKELSDRYPAETELEEVESSFWEGPNEQLSSDQLDAMGLDPEVFNVSYVELSLSSRVLRSNPKLAAEVAELRTVAGGHDHLRFPMDAVIRCFGWIFDSELLDPKTVPVNVTHHGKYPKITPAWEIKGVPGLYVAGTISHSLDFRKSAGGFIHGFRYTSRALFRSLEERNFGVAWPQQEWSIPLTCTPGTAAATCAAGAGASASAGWAAVADRLLERINAASGPYQMFEFLGDMLLFEPNGTELSLRLLEEVPLLHFHERYQDTARLTWSFRYHDHFHGPDVLSPFRVGATRVEEAHNSKFLHPHLAFFPAKSATPRLRHWMLEDVFTQWTGPDDRRPLLRFLTRAAAFLFAAT